MLPVEQAGGSAGPPEVALCAVATTIGRLLIAATERGITQKKRAGFCFPIAVIEGELLTKAAAESVL